MNERMEYLSFYAYNKFLSITNIAPSDKDPMGIHTRAHAIYARYKS